MAQFLAPIIIEEGENILQIVQVKFPEAVPVRIAIFDSKGNVHILSELSNHTSSIKRIAYYACHYISEFEVFSGDNILNKAVELHPWAEPENILIKWPKTNEWRPISGISNHISSITRMVRVTEERVTTTSAVDNQVIARENGIIISIKAPEEELEKTPAAKEHEADFYITEVPINNLPNFNQGITSPTAKFMIEKIGHPRTDKTLGEANNPNWLKKMKLDKIHPKINWRSWGCAPALEDLKVIFSQIDGGYPNLLQYVSYGGIQKTRYIAGTTVWSNHTFGCAIDIGIDLSGGIGPVDKYDNGKVQNGILLMVPFFRQLKWYWGGQYKTKEDGMHFEPSRERILEWEQTGKI